MLKKLQKKTRREFVPDYPHMSPSPGHYEDVSEWDFSELHDMINQLVDTVNELQRQLNAVRKTLTAEPTLHFDYTSDPSPDTERRS